MKKLLGILISVSIILFSTIAYSLSTFEKNTKLVNGNYYQGSVTWRFIDFELPEGKWEYWAKYYWSFPPIAINCINFMQLENKLYKASYEICDIHSGGKWANLLFMWINQDLKKGKYDNCTLRPEYFYAKLWIKGMAHNCFRTRHIDTNKELNYPDDPHDVGPVRMKHYFDINNVDVPKTVLTSDHIYYSPNVRDRGISIQYAINPELYGASKSLHGVEDQSEYHRRNINNYPDKKKFMENWTVLAARRHQEFENYVLAKSHHKLDFSDLDLSNVKTITSIDLDKETKNDLSSQLKSLNELYESGALTKEEFIKAKKKILN